MAAVLAGLKTICQHKWLKNVLKFFLMPTRFEHFTNAFSRV